MTAFDINLKEPSLLDYLPKLTETAEVDDTFGKMALMDRLIVNDSVPKVIDLGYHAFDEFFKMSEEIGFMKEAARRGIVPVVLFVADTDRASARGHQMLQAQIPPTRAGDHRQRIRGARRIAAGLRPRPRHSHRALPQFLKTYIDRPNFSFTGYLRTEKDSSTELHQWIRKNYFSFRELELADPAAVVRSRTRGRLMGGPSQPITPQPMGRPGASGGTHCDGSDTHLNARRTPSASAPARPSRATWQRRRGPAGR